MGEFSSRGLPWKPAPVLPWAFPLCLSRDREQRTLCRGVQRGQREPFARCLWLAVVVQQVRVTGLSALTPSLDRRDIDRSRWLQTMNLFTPRSGDCAVEKARPDDRKRCIFISHASCCPSYLGPFALHLPLSQPESSYHTVVSSTPSHFYFLSPNGGPAIYAIFLSLFDSRHRSCLRANEAKQAFTQKGSNWMWQALKANPPLRSSPAAPYGSFLQQHCRTISSVIHLNFLSLYVCAETHGQRHYPTHVLLLPPTHWWPMISYCSYM